MAERFRIRYPGTGAKVARTLQPARDRGDRPEQREREEGALVEERAQVRRCPALPEEEAEGEPCERHDEESRNASFERALGGIAGGRYGVGVTFGHAGGS